MLLSFLQVPFQDKQNGSFITLQIIVSLGWKMIDIKPMTKAQIIQSLMKIPGVGKSIANDLYNIKIRSIEDLIGKDPEVLFAHSNSFAGCIQDRCLLYVFRCAVYFAETPLEAQESEMLKWWNWKDIHK